MKKLLIPALLLASFSSFSMENPVFESLKADMMELGLSFEYMDGTHIVKPLDTNSDQEITGEYGLTEEVTHALNL